MLGPDNCPRAILATVVEEDINDSRSILAQEDETF